jgi:hypothetical protein
VLAHVARKKNQPKCPRRLRMNRQGRLQSARVWLVTQKGRTPAQIGKAYCRCYGVDWPCAIQELTQLGVVFDPQWVAQLTQSLEGHHHARAGHRAAGRSPSNTDFPEDSDEHFACIAGYTPNGVPFGVTREEWEKLKGAEEPPPAEPDPF